MFPDCRPKEAKNLGTSLHLAVKHGRTLGGGHLLREARVVLEKNCELRLVYMQGNYMCNWQLLCLLSSKYLYESVEFGSSQASCYTFCQKLMQFWLSAFKHVTCPLLKTRDMAVSRYASHQSCANICYYKASNKNVKKRIDKSEKSAREFLTQYFNDFII